MDFQTNNNVQFSPGDIFHITRNTTLYAQWERIPEPDTPGASEPIKRTAPLPPEIRVFSPDLVFLGEALGYTSAVYTRRWQSAGDFAITIPLDALGAKHLRPENIIMFDKDRHRTGIIESIEPSESDLSTVIVKGVSLSGMTTGRLTVPPDDAANMGQDVVPRIITPGVFPPPVSAETVLKEYAYRHLKADPDRDDPFLDISPDLERGIKTRWLSRFEDLGEVLRSICEFCDIGYEIYFDTNTKRLVFDVIEGIDRTVKSGISPVIFSSKYGNVNNIKYTHSLSGYKNLGYVGGAGEDENRLIQLVWSGDTKPTGRMRREVFLDAGSLTIAGGLEDEGLQKLSAYPLTESLAATVSPNISFVYRKDWDLGDFVTVQSDKIGITFDTRITEITERYESNAISIVPTFGTPLERLGRKIKRIERKNNVR